MDYGPDTYDLAAGRLMAMCVALLSDSTSMSALTHHERRESCHSEIEVCLEPTQEGRELVAKAVVDLVGDKPIKFDKAKLTKLVKARAEIDEWKAMKIFKKQVPNIPDNFTRQ